MVEDAQKKVRVVRGATSLVVRGILSSLIGTFYFAIVAREVGLEGMATISVLSLFYTLFPLIFLLAIPTAIQKFIAESLGKGDETAVNRLMRTTFLLSMAISVLSLIASLVAAPFIGNILFNGQYVFEFQFLSIAVATFIGNSLLSSIFFGFQLYEKYSVVTFAAGTVGQLVSLVFIVSHYGIPAFVLSWVVENFIVIILLLALRPKTSVSNVASYPITPLLSYSLPLFGSTLVSYLGSNVFIKLFILKSLSATDLGAYETAQRLAGIPKMYETAFLATFFPHLSRVYGEKGVGEVGHNVGWAVRLTAFVFSPILVGLGMLGGPLFTILFGREYHEAVPIFIVLLSFSMVNFLLSPFTQGMQTLGHTKRMFQIQSMSTLVEVISSLALASYGVLGVAVGAETLGLVSSLLNFHFFQKHVDAKIRWRSIFKLLFASLVMALPVYISLILLPRYRFLLIQILIGAATYAILVGGFKLVEKRDLDVISLLLPKRMRNIANKFFGPS